MGFSFGNMFTSSSKSTSVQTTSTTQQDYSVAGANALGQGAVMGGVVSGVNLSGGATLTVNPLSTGVIDLLKSAIGGQSAANVTAQNAAASLAQGAQAESVATKTGGLSVWTPWIIGGVVALAAMFFIFGKGK